MGDLVLFPTHELFRGTLPVACPVCTTEILHGIVVHADCAPLLSGLLPELVP